MELRNDINTDWGSVPYTGQQVLNAIKSQFNDIVTTVNNTVLDIVFDHQENTDEFLVTVTKVDGTITPYDIKLTPRSEKVINLTSFTVPSHSYPGEDVTIRYTYNITEDGVRINNRQATVKLYVNNGLIATFNAPGTYSNSDRTGTYVIPGKHIVEGNNSIRIDFTYSDSDGAATFALADGVFVNQNVLAFKLKLDANLTNNQEISQIIASPSDSAFGLLLTLTDSIGRGITSSPYNISSNSIKTVIYSGLTNTSNEYTGTTIDNLVLSVITGLTGTNLSSRNEYPFYILSSILIGDTTVVSDVVMFQLISNPQGDAPKFAFKLIGMPTLDKTINKIIATLYDFLNLELYAYIPNDNTVIYKVGEQEQNQVPVEGNTLELLNLSWTTLLLNSGENVISVLIGSLSFTLTVDTLQLANDLIPPSGAVIDFIPNGQSLILDEMTVNGYTFSFTGFDWASNGWAENGKALLINNGALLNINLQPLNSTSPHAISFRFKTVNENTNETLISCVKNDCNGFRITPQSATIYQGSQSKTTLFTSESNVKEVTFVWYGSNYGNTAIIYVNGTSLMILGAGTSTANDNTITITANDTSLYLYGILYYNKAITFSEVQALYNIHNGVNIGDYSKLNDIFSSSILLNTNNQGNGLKVTIDKLPIGSVYMLIRAHENGVREPWKTINELSAKQNGEETKSWRLLAGETFLIKKMKENQTAYAGNFYADRIALSALGTSSMNYPIKNYRIYFKKKITDVYPFNTGYDKTNPKGDLISYTKTFVTGSSVTNINFSPDSEINNVTSSNPALYALFNTSRVDENGMAESTYNSMPANVFCLKADYAESSGMHNTGFARMTLLALELSGSILGSGDVLYNTECAHLPMNEVEEAESFPYEVRLSIDGRQVYLFFLGRNQDGSLGDIVYAGKYNLNNEKASEDIFGFTNKEGNDPSYFDNEVVQNEAEHLKELFGISDSSFDDTHLTFLSSSGLTYVNPTECWEFSTNAPTDIEHLNILGNIRGNIGAFTFPYMKEDNVLLGLEMPDYLALSYRDLNPFKEKTNGTNQPLAWFCQELAWEPRYPDFDEEDAGYIAYVNGTKPYLLNSLYKWLYKNNVYLWPESQKESHAAVFARDLHLYFNVNYILKYYVLTKMFVNADLRIKNCMVSFYCDPKVEDNDGSNGNYPMGHMRAFYIFYDNDTILGVSNTGFLELPWNADETSDVYNGIDSNNISYHAVWGNIEYCYKAYINNSTSNQYVLSLGRLVETTYRTLRTVLTDDIISSYLNSTMPDAADNIDAEVKYMYPTVLNGRSDVVNYDSERLNQYLGNRKYHREWFLSKRTKWFDAIYGAGTISNYYFGFKFANDASGLSHNIVNIESEFNKWRFYYNSESATFTPTKLLTLTNNESDRIGSLAVTYMANSNTNGFFGLYGAKTIDFSNFYGNAQSSRMTYFSVGNSLPYLKKLIFGTTAGKLYIDNLGFINNLFVPNIEELVLVNLHNESTEIDSQTGNPIIILNLISCDLSSLSMLKSLDSTDTYLDVLLPEGAKLQSVKLYKPTKLRFKNNIALSLLNILDTTSISDININHCSDYIYNKIFDIIIERINNNSTLPTINIVIGQNDNPDDLSNSTIEKLVTLSNLIINNSITGISITGTGRNLTITDSQKAIIFNAFGSDLTIISTSSEEFTITLTSQYLRENGEPVLINTNRLATFTMLVTGDNASDLAPYITLNASSSASYMATLTAAPINDNTAKSCYITIIATSTSGETATSDTISVLYIPITSITASVVGNDYDIISENGSLITLLVDSMSTKQHLLNRNLIGSDVIISVNSGGLTPTYDTDSGMLLHLTYMPLAQSLLDDELSVSLFSTTVCKKTLYYDRVVCLTTELSSTSQDYKPYLNWLGDLFSGILDSIGTTTIKRSHLAKYTISTSNGTIYCSTGKNVAALTENDTTIYDLTALLYFRVSSTLFTVPTTFKFNNIVLPERISEFEWKSIYSNFYGYGTFVFPSSLNSAVVNLSSLQQLMGDLQFNLLKCNKIKRIYNNGTTQSAGVFSLSLTVETNLLTGVNHVLFEYPAESIDQIGNCINGIGGALLPSDASSNVFWNTAMFNVTYGGINWSYVESAEPFYLLGSPTNTKGLSVGYVSSYRLSKPCFAWGTLAPYVKLLSYTFYKGSGIDTNTNAIFTNIEEIGDGSFYCNRDSSQQWDSITIGSKCTKIGSNAFNNYSGSLYAGDLNATFNNVTHIYSAAFSLLAGSKIFNFTNLLYIGDSAFISFADSGHIINITTDIVPTFISSTNPFGMSKTNTINLTTTSQEVKNAFAVYKSDVNLYINGELQN